MEGVTLTAKQDQHQLLEAINILARQIKKKVGLRPSDIKQLAHVLLGLLNSLYRNNVLHL